MWSNRTTPFQIMFIAPVTVMFLQAGYRVDAVGWKKYGIILYCGMSSVN